MEYGIEGQCIVVVETIRVIRFNPCNKLFRRNDQRSAYQQIV